MKSIWCTADKAKAFDAAMKGDAISPATCKTDISKHYELGVQFGIQGTPAIILENGMMIPAIRGQKRWPPCWMRTVPPPKPVVNRR